MKKHFLFEVKIKQLNVPVFKEGMPQGVIASEVATYTLTEKEFKSSLFVMSLINRQEDFLGKNVEVIMTECDEEGNPI